MREPVTPPYIFFNGDVVPWEQATVHVWSETAIRAINVFEGLRAYWHEGENRWHLRAWRQHFDRLMQSARIMRIPHSYSFEDFDQGISSLLNALPYREHMYVRPTIYIERGRYGFRPEDVTTGMHIAAFPVGGAEEAIRSLRVRVSTWRRSGDLDAPPRIKAGPNYHNLRLAQIEAQQGGVDDAILLNNRGTVAETTGASVFIVRDGIVATPPFSSGILESVTRSLVLTLLREEHKHLDIVEREVERTELYVAKEIFACGTLLEMAAIVEVDSIPLDSNKPGPITTAIAKRYRDIVLGHSEDVYGWLTPVESVT